MGARTMMALSTSSSERKPLATLGPPSTRTCSMPRCNAKINDKVRDCSQIFGDDETTGSASCGATMLRARLGAASSSKGTKNSWLRRRVLPCLVFIGSRGAEGSFFEKKLKKHGPN